MKGKRNLILDSVTVDVNLSEYCILKGNENECMI